MVGKMSPNRPPLKLLFHLIRRDIEQKYRGSILGVAWVLLLPLFMLAVYTFVFGVLFKQRWGGATQGGTAEFAIMLFAGLIAYNYFSECVTRAPSTIVQNPNYVKKIVFPLHWLPIISLGAASFQACVSLFVLAASLLVVRGQIPWTFIAFPLVALPLVLLTAGVTWLLASLGVFLRDIGQIVGVAVSALLFVSPVFFPISTAPERLQWLLRLNPLALPIEGARDTLVSGVIKLEPAYFIHLLCSAIICLIGYKVFMRLRHHFADVL
jgi:lipopolysaccharide transport system permease protein